MEFESNLLIYQTEDGHTKIDVRLENETVWMTRKAIAELFQTSPQNITLHVKNIYEEDELDAEATCKFYLQVQKELKSLNRIVTMYLDYAKDQAERQRPMHMKDWTDKLNAFLQFNDRDILENAGKVSRAIAEKNCC